MTNPRSLEAYFARDPEHVSALERDIAEHIDRAMHDGRNGLAVFEYEVEREHEQGALPQWGGPRVSSVSATFTGMKKKRFIRPNGMKVRTHTGRFADRYELGDPLAPNAPVQPGVDAPDTRGRTAPIIASRQ